MEKTYLLAKINPPLSRATQTDQFQQSVSWQTADYMIAKADPYILGSESVNFNVIFGMCNLNEQNEIIDFQGIHRQGVTLSGEAISGWGTDDTSIYTSIASTLGISVVSTHQVQIQLNMF